MRTLSSPSRSTWPFFFFFLSPCSQVQNNYPVSNVLCTFFLSRTVFLFLLTSLDCCCCWILLSSMSLPVESSMDMMPGGFFLEGASSFSGTAGSSLLKRRTKVVQMTYFNEKCPNLFFFFLGCGFSGDFSWKIRKIIGVCI